MESEARRSLETAHQVLKKTLRELAKNLDRSQRLVAMSLGQIYSLPSSESTANLFEEERRAIAELANSVPEQEYYKEETREILGIDNLPVDQMTLTTEEYLHGLISMVNELPRLAMNSVTAGDFASPVKIAAFVKQLHAAFQVLNLKNDVLRKRFDGLKYDVKRVEEILYDLRLRNLVPDTPPVHCDRNRQALYELMLGVAK